MTVAYAGQILAVETGTQKIFIKDFIEATVVGEDPYAHQSANFDSPVVSSYKRGDVIRVYPKQGEMFFRVLLKGNKIGWIADNQVRIGKVKLKTEGRDLTEAQKKKLRQSFSARRFIGPGIHYISYTENTMGKDRSEGMPFYGLKISGNDTLVDGELFVETNILFHSGAPSYYEAKTGKGSDGFIVLANVLFETTLPQSKSHYLYFGFGPLFKFSHLSLDLLVNGRTKVYAADDMVLGAAFNAGIAFKMGAAFSCRLSADYYWEKLQYGGLGLGLQWEF